MEISSEVLFILVFLLISFLSWITEKLKGATGQGRSQRRAEEESWPDKEVTAERDGAPSGEATLQEIFQSLGFPMEEAQRREPPPLPEPGFEMVEEIAPPPLQTASTPEPPKVRLSKAEERALKAIQKGEVAIGGRKRGADATSLSTVRSLLRHDQLRTAFVLKEILDSPRCREDLHT